MLELKLPFESGVLEAETLKLCRGGGPSGLELRITAIRIIGRERWGECLKPVCLVNDCGG